MFTQSFPYIYPPGAQTPPSYDTYSFIVLFRGLFCKGGGRKIQPLYPRPGGGTIFYFSSKPSGLRCPVFAAGDGAPLQKADRGLHLFGLRGGGREAARRVKQFFFIYDLNPPGCGALFLRRGTAPACKKQTAFLLRLADFCFAPRRALAKPGALRQTQLPVSSTGRGRCVCPCSASPVSAAGSGSAAQPSTLLSVSPLPLRGIPPSGGINRKLLLQGAGSSCKVTAAQNKKEQFVVQSPCQGAQPQAGGYR